MKFLVFDVWADYAEFKKPFTTMSPQSFSIPTGTSTIGLISAVLGLDKNGYWQYFIDRKYKLAIGVKSPIKKVVIPINTIKVTAKTDFYRFRQHKQMTMEFIKDAYFRIYFYWENDKLFSDLVNKIKNHETFYTASLGLAWNLANFKFIGFFDSKEKTQQKDFNDFSSILKTSKIIDIDFGYERIFSNKIPVAMRLNREVVEYNEYIFNSDGKNIRAKIDSFYNLDNGENIVPI
jgi:CRISPR-associated protein Cas5h